MIDPNALVDLLGALLNGGLPLLLLYLYFQERQTSQAAREQLLQVQRDLYEKRIADYQLWLQLMAEYSVNKTTTKPLLPPPFSPPQNIPTPTPKQDIKSRSTE